MLQNGGSFGPREVESGIVDVQLNTTRNSILNIPQNFADIRQNYVRNPQPTSSQYAAQDYARTLHQSALTVHRSPNMFDLYANPSALHEIPNFYHDMAMKYGNSSIPSNFESFADPRKALSSHNQFERNLDILSREMGMNDNTAEVSPALKVTDTCVENSKVVVEDESMCTEDLSNQDDMGTNSENSNLSDREQNDEEDILENEEKAVEINSEDENIKESSESDISPINIVAESRKLQSDKVKAKIEKLFIKMEEFFPKCEIKVEPCSPDMDLSFESEAWADTEIRNPFIRDINGVQSDNVPNSDIANSESSAMDNQSDGLNGNGYKCSHCSLVFQHMKRFLIHTKWHSFGQVSQRKLEKVMVRKEVKRDVKRDVKKDSQSDVKKINVFKRNLGMNYDYDCQDCNASYKHEGSLNYHRMRAHQNTKQQCDMCDEVLPSLRALHEHKRASHSDNNEFFCDVCCRPFKSKMSLYKHSQSHWDKVVACPECPKMFGSKTLLGQHAKSHSRAAQGHTLHCSYCARGFYTKFSLSTHERTHREEKPFACEICKSRFNTNSSLRRHLRVSHDNAKPFECATCLKCFATEAIRDRHQERQHAAAGAFKFVCDECPYKYLTEKHLKKHIYKAHPKGRRKSKKEMEAQLSGEDIE